MEAAITAAPCRWAASMTIRRVSPSAVRTSATEPHTRVLVSIWERRNSRTTRWGPHSFSQVSKMPWCGSTRRSRDSGSTRKNSSSTPRVIAMSPWFAAPLTARSPLFEALRAVRTPPGSPLIASCGYSSRHRAGRRPGSCRNAGLFPHGKCYFGCYGTSCPRFSAINTTERISRPFAWKPQSRFARGRSEVIDEAFRACICAKLIAGFRARLADATVDGDSESPAHVVHFFPPDRTDEIL